MKKIIILLLLISLSSCALWQNRKENIINKELLLITDKDISQSQNIPYITIKADGRVLGSTGCNRILGTAYFGKSGEVIFKNVATTKMLCPQDSNIEEKFLYILNTTLYYQINRDMVYLMNGDKNPLVRLRIK